jgi:hypothetical protein
MQEDSGLEFLNFLVDAMNRGAALIGDGIFRLEETTFQGDYILTITHHTEEGILDLKLIKSVSTLCKKIAIEEMVYEIGSAGIVRIIQAQKSAKGYPS